MLSLIGKRDANETSKAEQLNEHCSQSCKCKLRCVCSRCELVCRAYVIPFKLKFRTSADAISSLVILTTSNLNFHTSWIFPIVEVFTVFFLYLNISNVLNISESFAWTASWSQRLVVNSRRESVVFQLLRKLYKISSAGTKRTEKQVNRTGVGGCWRARKRQTR